MPKLCWYVTWSFLFLVNKLLTWHHSDSKLISSKWSTKKQTKCGQGLGSFYERLEIEDRRELIMYVLLQPLENNNTCSGSAEFFNVARTDTSLELLNGFFYFE